MSTRENHLARTKDRPMGGYSKLPQACTVKEAAPWMDRALSNASSLPVKAPKKRAARKQLRKSMT